jgi:DNA-binding winged helix-turn-helix (wHTH) protein
MNSQNLIIYEFDELYKILIEIKKDININFEKASKNQLSELSSKSNSLIFTKNKIPGINNQIIFDKFPVPVFKLLEKINIEFLKKNFNDQSEISIGIYKFNLNSREMSLGSLKLKLTEKEINSIVYLNKAANSVKVHELQSKVWSYQSELETHTVETHIYRLRKKILKVFNDEDFIKSNKDGYQIKKKKINL